MAKNGSEWRGPIERAYKLCNKRGRLCRFQKTRFWKSLGISRPLQESEAGLVAKAINVAAVSSKHAGYRFEIQLRSVLMDAWAGISQDLEYKALSGELTIPEHKLLDAIKGHVEVGGLMLEQLHRVHRKRVETENERITTARELGEVLVDSVPDSQLAKIEIGDLEALLTGLRVVESDTPAGLQFATSYTCGAPSFITTTTAQPTTSTSAYWTAFPIRKNTPPLVLIPHQPLCVGPCSPRSPVSKAA